MYAGEILYKSITLKSITLKKDMFFNSCFIMFVNMLNGKEGILRLKALLGFVFLHQKEEKC